MMLTVDSFLNQCRPLSVSMGNAIKYLKKQITNISSSLNTEQVCATSLLSVIYS